MSELSGPELRKKACEALPPREHAFEGQHNCKGCGVHYGWMADSAGGSERCYPAIESDPAVSEPMFLEWCEKNELLWDLYSTRDGQISCAVYKPNHNGVHAHVFGASPSEARARAIVASRKEEGV